MSAAAVRVLVADDDVVARRWLMAVLAEDPLFAVIAEAADGESAAEVALAECPDLVLVDLNMPGGGGVAAARRIREECPDTVVVAVSAQQDAAAVRAMLEAGAGAYVLKGTSPDELLETLRGAVGMTFASVPEGVEKGSAARRPGDHGAVRVLVVEDAPAMLAALADLVESAGMELVGLAQTPFHAVSLAARHQPDVAIVDVGIPGGGGAPLTSDLRDVSPGTRVVAFTGHSEREHVLSMIGAGATGYVVKNGAFDELIDSVVRAHAGVSFLGPEATGVVMHELRGRLTSSLEQRRAPERLDRIDDVLASGALSIALQPIQRLGAPEAVGYEALARFPPATARTPDVWFAEAASVGRGLALELLAVEQALSSMPALPGDTFLSLNVSPEVAVCDELAAALAGAPSERIVLEITEHAPVADYDRLSARLRELRRRGVRLAVDDCGAGFASLRHVLLLAPDFIKLDIALVRGISDPMRRALTRALVGFAAETGSRVIAEGIESAEDLDVLREVGVELGQGFHLARPQLVRRAAA